jgi:hypothetical protein
MVLFRAYYKAIEKHKALTELLNNPNARVASGDQAKTIMKQLKVNKKFDLQEQETIE